MRFKDLASLIAKEEGLKSQLSVGNVREQLRITLILLSNLPKGEADELLSRYKNKIIKHQ